MSEVLIDETYQPVLAELPQKPLRVLDVGSHIGSFMLWLSQRREIEEAYCFEPDPESFNLCRFNLAQKSQLRVAKAAIGSTSRASRLLIDPRARARSTIVPNMERPGNVHSVETTVQSLPDWLIDHPGQFDLLKMDCEGAEWELLTDCPQAFSQFAVIIAEVHRDPILARTRTDFASLMRVAGFVEHDSTDRLFVGVRSDADLPAVLGG